MPRYKTRKEKRTSDPLNFYLAEELDDWQEEVIAHNGNVALRAGRQVGKSFTIAKKACKFACDNPNSSILVVAAAQRESSFIFEKIQDEFLRMKDDGNNYFLEKPTQTKIKLINGSTITSLPTGRTGYYIRGQTLDLLIADEAAFIPSEVWVSIIPMIAVRKQTKGTGFIWVLSTPRGKRGFFYECFNDEEFKSWHISSETCSRIPKLLLEKQKRIIPKNTYLQEWCGEFVDDSERFFPQAVIDSCIMDEMPQRSPSSKFYLGVDVARYGGDENALVVLEITESEQLIVREVITTQRKSLVDTFQRIKDLSEQFEFQRIFIDDAGVGGGLTDFLINEFGDKVLGLNNASRSVQDKKKRILKEDLYSNALVLMERGVLKIPRNLDLLRSLDSIDFKYTENENLRIYGEYTHITEALVRSVWGFVEKGLNIFIHYF